MMSTVDLDSRVFVAGHRGMVGAAILRALQAKGYSNLITRTHAELDLTNQAAVRTFFETERIDQIYLAAAKVGGIHANNTYPAEFIYQNLMIQSNVIHEAWRSGIKNLLFLGSSCIYPRDSPQPIQEDYLLKGPLEPTNEPYAIAKILGIKMCESYNRQYDTDFRSVMPCNLYGPGDNYHPENSHVIPALIRRIHEAKTTGKTTVAIWGTGTPKREFLYVEDLAAICIRLTELDKNTYRAHIQPMSSHVNIGSGDEITISQLATMLCRIIGFEGDLTFDDRIPDGAPRKLMAAQRLAALGLNGPLTSLDNGLRLAFSDFVEQNRSLTSASIAPAFD